MIMSLQTFQRGFCISLFCGGEKIVGTALYSVIDFMFVCLFVFLALRILNSPVAGFSLLIRDFLITHDAPQLVGLLWTSDQSVAETSA